MVGPCGKMLGTVVHGGGDTKVLRLQGGKFQPSLVVGTQRKIMRVANNEGYPLQKKRLSESGGGPDTEAPGSWEGKVGKGEREVWGTDETKVPRVRRKRRDRRAQKVGEGSPDRLDRRSQGCRTAPQTPKWSVPPGALSRTRKERRETDLGEYSF